MGLIIRRAVDEDAKRLLEIYSYYVENTAVSFEYNPPTEDEFRNRIRHTLKKYPYLVCEKDGFVEGYAYAGAYSTRDAYMRTAASSVYIDKDMRRQGIGKYLYTSLEEMLKQQGIVNLLAGVAYTAEEDEHLTHDSFLFHKKAGFVPVAHLQSVGRKFDRWYDLRWMQKRLTDDIDIHSILLQ